MSLCIASYLGLPLIQLDVGSLMSKWVGESERNMREAIRLLEGLGSCVLQLDEIEKGFGGVGGEMDGGSAQRSFGIFLKWLSDRSCPVYVVATANNIRPCRSSSRARAASTSSTASTCPRTRNARRSSASTCGCANASRSSSTWMPWPSKTEGYTGADIKEVVQLGLKLAFHAGAELTTITSSPPSPRSGRCRRPIPNRSPKSPSGSTATPSRPATATPITSAQRQRPQAARDRLIRPKFVRFKTCNP
jgi:SpoVK/Ycf46/Vps4 family AAA+-type ATPase